MQQISEPVAEPRQTEEPDPFTEVEPTSEWQPTAEPEPVVLPSREQMEQMHETVRPGTMDDMEAELRRMEHQPVVLPVAKKSDEDDPFTELPVGGSLPDCIEEPEAVVEDAE